MNNRPIHENLDTSYVNLSALVRYLRRRQFAGNVRVELSGYEADISLTATNEMRVREHDRIAGRVAEGEEALQRILIRAREPGGIINVYQAFSEETAPIIEKPAPVVEKIVPVVEETHAAETEPISVAAKLPNQNGSSGNGKNQSPVTAKDLSQPNLIAQEFPFEPGNNLKPEPDR
jgi:hypothetical protein